MKLKPFAKRIILIIGVLFLLSFAACFILFKGKVIVFKNTPFNIGRLDKFKINADNGKKDSIKIIFYQGIRNSVTVELSVNESKVITFISDASNSKEIPKDGLKIHSAKCSKLTKGNDDNTVHYRLPLKDKKGTIELLTFEK